jgi:hypothetical protein
LIALADALQQNSVVCCRGSRSVSHLGGVA